MITGIARHSLDLRAEAAWALVQKGQAAKKASPHERLYLAAVAALFKNGGAGSKEARDEAYRDAMAAAYASFPDDETKLFYGLAILGPSKKGRRALRAKHKQPNPSRRCTRTLLTIPELCTI